MTDTKDTLCDCLATCLANVTFMYHRTHGAHWNVIGADFPQWHSKFAEIYEDVYGSIDPFAENIRKCGEFAPFTLATLQQYATVPDIELSAFDAPTLVRDLLRVNEGIIDSLYMCFNEADAVGEEGIMNFIAERIDAHQKWEWQLGAIFQ